MVPKAHRVAAMNGCCQDAGHQGQQWTLYLLHDQFLVARNGCSNAWKVISNCEQCILCEGTQYQSPSAWPIIVTAPLELLHICWLYLYWDNDGIGSTPKCGEHFGLLLPLYETCYGTHDSGPNCKNCCHSFCGMITSQSSEPWPGSWVIEEPTLKATSSESFCELMGMRKARTLQLIMLKPTEQVERAHQMLMHMIGKLGRDWKATCPKHLPEVGACLKLQQHQLSPDTAHIIWCLGINDAYPSTSISPW